MEIKKHQIKLGMRGKENPYKQKIMIVEDDPSMIAELAEMLKDDYILCSFTRGIDALSFIQSLKTDDLPDLILLDVKMPGMNGYEVCQNIKSNPLTQSIPVIFLTSMDQGEDQIRGFRVGAVDYIIKPPQAEVAQVRIKTHLNLAYHQDFLLGLLIDIERVNRTIQSETEVPQVLDSLLVLASMIAIQRASSSSDVYLIKLLAIIHGISNQRNRIPNDIFVTSGRLTKYQLERVKHHINPGKILGKIELSPGVLDAFNQHHERLDGSGFPRGLQDNEIVPLARLFAVADMIDSNSRLDQPMQEEIMGFEATLKYLKEGEGRWFDPDIVSMVFLLRENGWIEKKISEGVLKYKM